MAAYNPTIVEQLNKKRRDAAQAGQSTDTGLLRDYDTFAASLAPTTPVTAPLATPATAYKDLGLTPYNAAPDEAMARYGAELEQDFLKPFNEKDVYRQKLNQFQSETDANNRVFAEKLGTLQLDKTAQVGRARALEAAGAGGYGGVVTATRNANRPIDLAAAELETKIAQIENSARTAADSEVANKKAARAQGYTSYTQYLKDTETRKDTYADQIAQTILDQDVDMTEVDLETLSKTYGIPKQLIVSKVLAKQKELEEAERKAELEGRFALSPGETQYDAEGNAIASIAPTPDYETLSAGETLIDPVTGEEIYAIPEAVEEEEAPGKIGEYEYAIENGLIPPETTLAEYVAGKDPGKVGKEKERNIAKAQIAIDTVDEAINSISRATTGFFGARAAGVEGTKAYDLEKTIDTLKAILSFQELEAMRAASPTGGALGSITERELALLGSTVANMDIGQSPEALRQNLLKVKAAATAIRDSFNEDGEETISSSVSPGRIRVQLRNGQVGTIDEADFDPSKHTKV